MENPVPEPLDFDREPGKDALCFMAGPQGAYFSAGVVHAYLAADRAAPVVVAGISAGSLTAAAMYRAYADVKLAAGPRPREAARWKWFRHYVDTLTYDPLAPIWDAIPNPIDFFADTMPVEDPTCPPDLKKSETQARTQFHRMVMLGNWIGGLPVTVADVADAIVRYVRWTEGYALPWIQLALLVGRGLWISWLVTLQIAFAPRMIRPLIYEEGQVKRSLTPTPLLGRLWPAALGWLAFSAAAVYGAVLVSSWDGYRLLAGAFISLLTLLLAVFGPLLFFRFYLPSRITPWLLKPLGLDQGLLRKYALRRWLLKLFDGTAIETPGPGKGPFHLLIVAAALNPLSGPKSARPWERPKGGQLWARPGVLLREALASSLAVPTLFAPERVKPKNWLDDSKAQGLGELVLVDGAVIRSNPLPALFNWMDRNWKEHRDSVEKLFHAPGQLGAALRVVYSVPITGLSREEELRRESLDIVENAFMSFALQRRRDTEMESLQTQFVSTLEAHRRAAGGQTDTGRVRFPVFPMPISPEGELKFSNPLNPTREEGLRQVAQGCRRTLESIYRNQLRTFGQRQVLCHSLVQILAPERAEFIRPEAPGVAEVCGACSRLLNIRPVEDSRVDKSVVSYGIAPEVKPHSEFPKLTGEKPRIVFVANGGVFRGSFHVGVAAGLQLAGIQPDLVVGASVGSIIGAAVSALTQIGDPKASARYVGELAGVFLDCDKEVALTREFKRLMKHLGVRARAIEVSPRLLRQRVRKGSRGDSSYAITGAPPVLIDAISDLFLIPHRTTQEIAATFVAGKITDAAKLFFQAVQKETLRRLAIEECIMGTDLLERTAKRLLFPDGAGADRSRVQPYAGTAFFATSTLLSRRATVLLGRDFPEEIPAPAQYNFVEACLASSAFPVVFAPRATSEIFPGRGRTDALLCDGGIFDNLPFFPAITVLSDMQKSVAEAYTPEQSYEFLQRRQKQPVLMIAAGLDAGPPEALDVPADLLGVRELAGALNAHVKIDSFERTSQLVYELTESYLAAYSNQRDKIFPRFANGLVPAAVLKILPQDQDHLNGTFAFCKSTGLDEKKMQTSIGHGCFQTLDALASAAARQNTLTVLGAALSACERDQRVKIVTREKADEQSNACPFYRVNDKPVECPFTHSEKASVRGIYTACREDPIHTHVRQ